MMTPASLTHTHTNQNTHSTSKVRTIWGIEDILAGPDNFKNLFEAEDLPLRFRFRFRSGLRSGGYLRLLG